MKRGKWRGKRELRLKMYASLKGLHGGVVPCFLCRRPVRFEDSSLEHIVPRSQGGSDTRDNLAISHRRCNFKRGAS